MALKKLKYLVFVLLLSACNLGGGEVRPLVPPFMPAPPQGGPQEFQQGWKDGCDTGLAAHGTDVYRAAFKFTQNPALVLNPIYYKAWKDAENYCRTYIYEYTIRSMDLFCTVDGLFNDCADNAKTPAPFMGTTSPEAFGGGVIGGGGGGVGSVMGTEGGAPGNVGGDGGLWGSW